MDRLTAMLVFADVAASGSFTASAESEEELMKKVAAHAAHDHGVSEVTPVIASQVKAAIKHQ